MAKTALKNKSVLFADLSYQLTGLCFQVHRQLGRFAKEKQYCDLLENKLKESGIKYVREFNASGTGNRVDFIADDKILLEIKAKPFVTKDDYYQTQRYLKILNLKLGIIINFQNIFIKQHRIINFQN